MASSVEVIQQAQGLMSLPAEVRLMILHYLMQPRGVIKINASLEFSKGREVDKNSIALLGVNRTIRAEIQADFYSNQTFRFSSIGALEKFLLKIGKRNASFIRSIELDQLACNASTTEHWGGMMKSIFTNWLTAVDQVSIIDCQDWNIPGRREFESGQHAWWLRDRVLALLIANKNLARGQIYIKDPGGVIDAPPIVRMQFLPWAWGYDRDFNLSWNLPRGIDVPKAVMEYHRNQAREKEGSGSNASAVSGTSDYSRFKWMRSQYSRWFQRPVRAAMLGSYDRFIIYTRPQDPHYLPLAHHITPVSIPYQQRYT